MSEIENTANGLQTIEKGFFGKLSSGDFGLAKTYWLYGVLVGFVLKITMKSIESIGVLVIVMLVYSAYEIPVLMGTWRAATKYKGSKIWAVLAKVVCILGALMLIVGFLATVGLMKNA